MTLSGGLVSLDLNERKKFTKLNQSEAQEFFNATFYSFDVKNEPFIVNSLKVFMPSGGKKVLLTEPFGSIKTSGQKMKYKGSHGEVFLKDQEVRLNGRVVLSKPDLQITGDKMILNQQSKEAFMYENVRTFLKTSAGNKIRIRSKNAEVKESLGLINYEENVSGVINFKDKKYSPKILFSSESLSYFISDSKMTLEENVNLRKENIHLKARYGRVLVDRVKNDIGYFKLIDDVKFREAFTASNGQRVERTGISQVLEGFGPERKIVMSGYPKIKQLDDLIQGNKIILKEESELVEIINTNSKFRFEE